MSLMNDALRKKSRESEKPAQSPGLSVTDWNKKKKNKKRIILLATAVLLTISALSGVYLIRTVSNSAFGSSQIPPELLLQPLNDPAGSPQTVPKEIFFGSAKDFENNHFTSNQPVDVPVQPTPGAGVEKQSSPTVLDQTIVHKATVSPVLTSMAPEKKEGGDKADVSSATSLHAALHSKYRSDSTAERLRTTQSKKKAIGDKQSFNSFRPNTAAPGQKHDFVEPFSQENDPFYRKALTYHRNGQFTDAVRIYQKVLLFDSDHQGAMLNLAAIHIEQGRFHEALTLLKQMEFSSSRPRGVLLNLAMAATGTNDAEQALDYLKKAQEESDASLYDIQLHRAVAYSRLDRLPEALTLYQKILEGHPDDTSVRFNLAVTCDALGLYPKALTHYEVVLQASSDIDKISIHRRMQTIGRHLNTNQDMTVR